MSEPGIAGEHPDIWPRSVAAVREHGEQWVLDNYYPEIYPLGVIMDVPEKSKLPFFDPAKHEEVRPDERKKVYNGWRTSQDALSDE